MNDERPTVTYTRLSCPTCRYNLTGLTSGRCPECGTAVDLEALRTAAARRPIGTPVYRSRGWRLFPDTLRTLLLMLFRPWEFAKRLRVDEPFAPAAWVFLLAVLLHPTMIDILIEWESDFPLALCLYYFIDFGLLALCVAVLAIPLAILSLPRHPSFRRFFLALRFWCIVPMYTMVLAIVWPWLWRACGLTWWPIPSYWPRFDLEACGRSVVFIWWLFILAAVLWRRVRHGWLAILLMPLAYVFARLAVLVTDALNIHISH